MKEYIDWLNTKVLQKVALADEEDNFLAMRRAKTGSASRLGMWDLSGGSISPEDLNKQGEPHQTAIKREVEQETGLEITDLKIIFISSWVFDRSPGEILGLALGYQAKVKGVRPEVKLSEEHIEYDWFSKEKILALDFGEDGGLHKAIIEEAVKQS